MRKFTGVIAVLVTVLVAAPGALAAPPEEIYRDLADNGQLNGTYTQADLQAFLQSASVQGYGNPVVVVPPPVVTETPPQTVNPTPTPVQVPAPVQQPPAAELPAATPVAPTAGVAGTAKTIVTKAQPAAAPTASVAGVATPAQAPLDRTASAETLPFTGAELGLFAVVGAALLLGGLLLRSSARQR